MRDTIDITNLIQQVTEVVKEYFDIRMDEESLSYERFVTHLRFWPSGCLPASTWSRTIRISSR